jgi:hypothetical protein
VISGDMIAGARALVGLRTEAALAEAAGVSVGRN